MTTPGNPSTHANPSLTRRQMLQTTGGIAAASAFAGMSVPLAHAGESNTIQIALIGAGGRGTGAAFNALSSPTGPVKLVAMADVFPDKLQGSYKHLKAKFGDAVDVPPERQFMGFDGYKKAIDCLKPGDLALFATPPAFRPLHFEYALRKGVHAFMEKPITVDGPSTRRMLELAAESQKKNLKVGVGLMCRHCDARQALYERIKAGEIGDISFLRAYRMTGPVGSAFVMPNPGKMSDLMYQVRHFHGFLWASGGCYSDFLIHNIDECCWMKDAWPVEAKANGGRHDRGNHIDQNFDTYSVEYTFADGTKLFLEGRNRAGSFNEFASYAHGSKGMAVISTSSHAPAKCRIYKGHVMDPAAQTWAFGPKEPNPYQLEWDHLLDAIRNDKPFNEVVRGAEASLVTSMGRMAAHTGRLITRDQMLNCEHDFAPDLASLTFDSPAPLLADASGKYPVPAPGIKTTREF